MDDLTVDRLIRLVEVDPPVRSEFADRLGRRLSADLGFTSRGSAGWLARLVGPVGVGRATPRSRLQLVVVLALLAALLTVSLMAIGSRLTRRDPAELVRLSQAASAHPPVFTATIESSGSWRRDICAAPCNENNAVQRLTSNGAGTWRIDVLDPTGDPSGTYILYDGSKWGKYYATSHVWKVFRPPDAPMWYPLGTQLQWIGMEADYPRPSDARPRAEWFSGAPPQAACARPTLLAESVVAGHPADHLQCSDSGDQFWLDETSHLVLRFEAGPGSVGQPAGATIEAISFSLGGPVDGPAFSMDGPRVAVGTSMPVITGSEADGTSFTTASFAGRPYAVLLWCPPDLCAPSPDLRVFAQAVGARADRLGAVVVAEAGGDLRAASVDVGFDGPMIVGDPVSLESELQMNGCCAGMFLVDAAGRIQSVSANVTDALQLWAMLDALLAGSPVPEPIVTPFPSRAPDAISTRLVLGQPAPTWTVPSGTGTLSVEDLRGAPAIIYYGLNESIDDPARVKLLSALQAAQGSRGGVRVVLVDANPYGVDDVRSALGRKGLTMPVVADRDGAVSESWGLIYWDDLVFLDATGRVAWFGAGPCLDTAGLIRDFLDGRTLPAPALDASC